MPQRPFAFLLFLAATVGEGETKGVSCVSACPLIYDKSQNMTARNASSEKLELLRIRGVHRSPQVAVYASVSESISAFKLQYVLVSLLGSHSYEIKIFPQVL